MKESSEIHLSFEEQKTAFFVNLGLRAREWLQAHKELGKMWDGKKADRWENVSKHCLVEAARSEVFAELLDLSEEVKQHLFAGAILHDFDKKDEIMSTAKKGRTPESFMESYGVAKEKLITGGFDESAVEIAESVGPSSFPEIDQIVKKPELTEQDIAKLVLHYIDDYTLGSEWVENFDGEKNAFDKRMEANESNTKYSQLAEAGWFKEQRRLGQLVESRIAELLKAEGVNIDAKMIPEFVDAKIKEKIIEL